jgi:hypothetical protein
MTDDKTPRKGENEILQAQFFVHMHVRHTPGFFIQYEIEK